MRADRPAWFPRRPGLLLALALAVCWQPAGAVVGVYEGDTKAELYVNSQYIPMSEDLPVLPMNSVRRHEAAGNTAKVVRTNNNFQPGDVLGLKVTTVNPETMMVEDALGVRTYYPGLVGVIAAFADGTATTDKWKCVDEEPESGPGTAAWHSPQLSDDDWPDAVMQDLDCCPWRDLMGKWQALGARWIAPELRPGNVSGPRYFFCRYTVPEDAVSRLPQWDVVNEDPAAPQVNITKLSLTSSLTQIMVNVTAPAIVSCGVIDTRYKLRAPTTVELETFGKTQMVYPTQLQWDYATVPTEECGLWTAQDFNTTVIEWHTVEIIEQCEDLCYAMGGECQLMTYYESGKDLATGANCRLGSEFDRNRTLPDHNAFACFTHKGLVPVHTPTMIAFGGMLVPGTLYEAFCAARSNQTRGHSSWEVVRSGVLMKRSGGCIDCGATGLPQLTMLGGWASDTSIAMVVTADKTGRIFCAAFQLGFMNETAAVDSPRIRDQEFYAILTMANTSVVVLIYGLQPNAPHEVGCVAEGDGGTESSLENIGKSRRKWWTEPAPPTIISMTIRHEEVSGTKLIRTSAQVTAIGYLWCNVINTNASYVGENYIVPRAQELKDHGFRQRVEDLRTTPRGVFNELNVTDSYDIFCTAAESDFANETAGNDLLAPYPSATIMSYVVHEDSASLMVHVDRGPSSVFCQAFEWKMRPNSQRPAVPKWETMVQSPFSKEVPDVVGGTNLIQLMPLSTGTFHDIFCYAEDLAPPLMPGEEPPDINRMPPSGILRTRTQVRTLGPRYEIGGWHCVAGYPCAITEMTGVGMSAQDQVVVRANPCPGFCMCAGQEDPERKGATCLDVTHATTQPLPQPGESYEKDPKGAWCYVEPGRCYDATPSETFPDLLVSYHVCTFNSSIHREAAGPPGFPNKGLASQLLTDGTAYGWGDGPLLASGAAYYICWCNSTISMCETEQDHRISIGRLHVSGPTALQAQSTVTCVGGTVCNLTNFATHAAVNGSRLVVLPDTPLGCKWERASEGEPTASVGFPREGNGVSEGAFDQGTGYSWGSTPINAETGTYLLCWCGPQNAATTPPREGDAPYYHGGIKVPCADDREPTGGHYLGMAGRLLVTGTVRYPVISCGIGEDCIIQGIQGNGLTGGDQVAVLTECGVEESPPPGWSDGLSAMPEGKWIEGGWLKYGPPLRAAAILSIGVNVTTGRAVWGFPNGGQSLPDSRLGYFKWGGPVWAFAGEYMLCWCADRGDSCREAKHFNHPVSLMKVTGPQVLPSVSQVFTCIRGRKCGIVQYQGTMEEGSMLMISRDPCGNPPPYGAPREGRSLSSPEGTTYDWGSEPITLKPELYRLCWCPNMVVCVEPSSFTSYAGVLRVKGITQTPETWYCAVGRPCNVSGIVGVGQHSEDKVMALSGCGHGQAPEGFTREGISISTADDGTSFILPASTQGGRYKLCWCPGEGMCARGPDFETQIGNLVVGGPDPSAVYICHEWAACEIPALKGASLTGGDRMMVVPAGSDCKQAQLPQVLGFPQGGLSNRALDGGFRMSWGSGLVRAEPGVYDVCWCDARTTIFTDAKGLMRYGCDENGPFPIRGGSIRIGNSQEYQYLTRPADPKPRDYDELQTAMFSVVLPFLFLVAMILGCRKLAGSRAQRMKEKPEPEAPPLFKAKTSFAAAAQAKARHMFQVKEVLETRLTTVKGSSKSAKISHWDQDVPNFMHASQDGVRFSAESIAWKDNKAALGDKKWEGHESSDEKKKKKDETIAFHPSLSRALTVAASPPPLPPAPQLLQGIRGARHSSEGSGGANMMASEGSMMFRSEGSDGRGGGRQARRARQQFVRSHTGREESKDDYLSRIMKQMEEKQPDPPKVDPNDRDQFSVLNRPNILRLLDT